MKSYELKKGERLIQCGGRNCALFLIEQSPKAYDVFDLMKKYNISISSLVSGSGLHLYLKEAGYTRVMLTNNSNQVLIGAKMVI